MTDFMKALAGLITAFVALATLALSLGLLAPGSSPPPSPANGGLVITERLNGGNSLHRGDRLAGLDGETVLVLEPDGDLVLFVVSTNRRLWERSGLKGDRLEMQGSDGNLVLYAADRPVWESDTAGHPGAYLVLQNDSNLVVRVGDEDLWASNTED